MKETEFIEKRNALLNKKKDFEAKIDAEYQIIGNDFINANSPVEHGKVYERAEKGRKKYTRFVIYQRDVIFLMKDSPCIRVGGWWLDKDNIPKKWDTLILTGVANPTELILSEDQTNKPHPESKKE